MDARNAVAAGPDGPGRENKRLEEGAPGHAACVVVHPDSRFQARSGEKKRVRNDHGECDLKLPGDLANTGLAGDWRGRVARAGDEQRVDSEIHARKTSLGTAWSG